MITIAHSSKWLKLAPSSDRGRLLSSFKDDGVPAGAEENRKQRHVTQADERELLVLPPVADDPVFVDDRGDYIRPLGSDPHDFAALYLRQRWSFPLHARRYR